MTKWVDFSKKHFKKIIFVKSKINGYNISKNHIYRIKNYDSKNERIELIVPGHNYDYTWYSSKFFQIKIEVADEDNQQKTITEYPITFEKDEWVECIDVRNISNLSKYKKYQVIETITCKDEFSQIFILNDNNTKDSYYCSRFKKTFNQQNEINNSTTILTLETNSDLSQSINISNNNEGEDIMTKKIGVFRIDVFYIPEEKMIIDNEIKIGEDEELIKEQLEAELIRKYTSSTRKDFVIQMNQIMVYCKKVENTK